MTLSQSSLFSLAFGVNYGGVGYPSFFFISQRLFAPGSHTIYWDGRESYKGQLWDFSTFTANLGIMYDSLSLPENSIIVGAPAAEEDLILNSDAYAILPSQGELTDISYTLSISGNVTLAIYQPSGSVLVKKLVDNQLQNAGSYALTWDGTDASGKLVSESGNYIILLELTTVEKTITMRANITIDIVGQ